MNLLFASFWRALALSLHRRVLLVSLLPLLLLTLLYGLWVYAYWAPSLAWVQDWFEHWQWMDGMLSRIGIRPGDRVKDGLTAFLLLLLVTPLLALLSVMVVSLILTPIMTRLVARVHFPLLERRHGASLGGSIVWAIWSTLLALILMLLSVPLWLIAPLILILPPLIWGWLTYRIMSYDALAEHASREERVALMREHRLRLLIIGTLCGLLGALPTLFLASGFWLAVTFMFSIPLAMWLYTLIFAFSGLWFANYTLAALEHMRQQTLRAAAPVGLPVPD